MDTAAIRNIALVRLSALGDVTMMLVVVRTLQLAFPGAKVTWIIGSPAYELLRGLDGVEFIVVDSLRSPRDYLRFGARLRRRRFDVLLAMQASLRANLLYPIIRAPLKIGFDRQRARDGQWLFTNRRIPFARQHLLDGFMAFAAAIGVEPRPVDTALPLDEEDRRWARARLPPPSVPLLVVNPGASKPERNWPVNRYAEVIGRVQRQRCVCVVLTGGRTAEEHRLADGVRRGTDGAVRSLVGRTTPRQLAAVLEAADCVLAPDTGPAHIAAAMGTPVVGLYAVAPASLCAPYACRHLAVDHHDEAVRTLLGRDPARLGWGVRVHDARAMELIGVEEVTAQVERVLEGRHRCPRGVAASVLTGCRAHGE